MLSSQKDVCFTPTSFPSPTGPTVSTPTSSLRLFPHRDNATTAVRRPVSGPHPRELSISRGSQPEGPRVTGICGQCVCNEDLGFVEVFSYRQVQRDRERYTYLLMTPRREEVWGAPRSNFLDTERSVVHWNKRTGQGWVEKDWNLEFHTWPDIRRVLHSFKTKTKNDSSNTFNLLVFKSIYRFRFRGT